MATSNSFDFRLDVEQIITEAYERCGIDNQTRTGYQALSARRSLNLLFSEWANRGINYWTVQNNTLSLVDGQTIYSLPVGTIDLIDVVVRETIGATTTDTVLQRVSIADYNEIPNKTDEGKPTQYLLNKQYTPTLYLWQVPNSSTAYSLVYWSINQLEDITASNQEADVPYRWADCICAGLSSKLALKFAPDRFQVLDQIYERTFDLAAATDNDGVTMRVRPSSMNLS